MKKILSILLILSMLVCMIPGFAMTASAVEATGEVITPDTSWWDNRSADDRIFILYDAADLLGFAKIMTERSKTGTRIPTKEGTDSSASYMWKFILANDIDLNPGWDASSGKTPPNVWPKYNGAFYFHGTFDGQGHTIKGFYQDNEDDKYSGGGLTLGYTGLFGGMYGRDAHIQNLTILNAYSTTSQREGHGILFGCAHNGAKVYVNNVYIDAYMVNTSAAAGDYGDGGFIGSVVSTGSFLEITNSVFAGNISLNTAGTSRYWVGGFVGRLNCDSSKIEKCAFYGNIKVTAPSAEAVMVGKFAAYQSCAKTTLTVKECIAGGTMSMGDGSAPNIVTSGSKNGIIFGELVGAARYNNGFSLVAFENNFYTGDNALLGCGYQQGTAIHTQNPASGTQYYTGSISTNTKNAKSTDLNTAASAWGWRAMANGKPVPATVNANVDVACSIFDTVNETDATYDTFTQVSLEKNANNLYDMRFVVLLKDRTACDGVVFDVTAARGGVSGATLHSDVIDQCYKTVVEIKADGNAEHTAAGDGYYVICVINNVDLSANTSFAIRANAVDENGAIIVQSRLVNFDVPAVLD